jgi:hypothetical protein
MMVSRKKLTLIYLVDGARPDVMKELLEAGELPNIQKHIVEQGTFRMASSCFPTTTGPAYLPFLTGCFSGTLNITGIRWLDKQEYHRKGWSKYKFRSYNGPEAAWFNGDLPKEYPTLFELFDRPYNILSMITRGLPKSNDLNGYSKPFLYLYAHVTGKWDPVDQASHTRLMKVLDENPEFVFTVFPGVDSYSHLFHPTHKNTMKAYRYVDFSVGQVAEKLKKSGRWDDTLLIITSDHGLTATHTHLDLALFLQDQGLKTMYYPLIWKKNPQASIMISGNAFGHVYLLNGFHEKLSAAANNPAAVLGETWQELINREEVDFAAWREDEGVYHVEAARGKATVFRQNGGLCYQPQQGDPFGLGNLSEPLDNQQSLEVTFHSEYPDAMVQLDQLFSASRSGDFVVVSQKGYDLRRAYEWPEHHSSHGSLHREHMHVPLIYNQTGWDTRAARTADLFNTILKWSGKPTLENTDGRSLIK